MEAYFSHSYRDVPINTYFSEFFTNAGITLRADQKTDVWCVAKLERYLFEKDGFVSVIRRRIAADESIAYSTYIAHELMLARRSCGPRISFVDGCSPRLQISGPAPDKALRRRASSDRGRGRCQSNSGSLRRLWWRSARQ